jgi:hypothetical protein
VLCGVEQHHYGRWHKDEKEDVLFSCRRCQENPYMLNQTVNQRLIGYPVKRDMPGLKGPEVQALCARGEKWLAGEPL